MTATSWTVSSAIGVSDAAFRAWGQAISAALAALGLVQTADTGQINWSTVTKPTVNATAQGYEVWRFADALQATAPVYVKIEYGSATSSTTAPGIWVTVGTGSNGSGTITGTDVANVSGAVTSRLACLQNGATGPTATSWAAADADGSALALALHPNAGASNGGMFVLIERTRDWSGVATGDGVLVAVLTSGAAKCGWLSYLPFVVINNFTVGIGAVLPGGSASGAPSVTTCVINNVVYPIPVQTGNGPRSTGFSKFLTLVCAGDLPPAATMSLTVYGEANTWYSAGLLQSSGAAAFSNALSNLNSFVWRIS
jgi:hypothetical protein